MKGRKGGGAIKKFWAIYRLNLETYTKNSLAADEEPLCVKGAIAFLISLKRAIKKKRVLETLLYTIEIPMFKKFSQRLCV